MEKNCITCHSFTWWDGDYCCIKKLKILCNAPNGEMNNDIKIALKMNKDCKGWEEGSEEIVKMHQEAYNKLNENR